MPDGFTIVSGSGDKTVKIWDSRDGSCIMTIQCIDTVTSLLPFGDGRTILAGLSSDSGIYKIDLFDGAIIGIWRGIRHVTALILLEDNRTVLSSGAESSLKLWDSNDGTCLATLETNSDWVYCLALLPPSIEEGSEHAHQRAVCGTADCTLIIWDVFERRPIITLVGHTSDVSSVACPSYNRIISGSDDTSIRLWDAISGACLRVMHKFSTVINDILVLSSDIIALSCIHDPVIVWQISTNEQLQKLDGHKNSFCSLALLVDGRLVSGSSDTTIRIWDLSASSTG